MEAEIKGSAGLVITGLQKLPAKMDRALGGALSQGLQHAARISMQQYLSGPRPGKLDIRTRRLRDSIVTEVEAEPGKNTGRIGTNVTYAAFHEFGFHGVMNVRAHGRVTGMLSATGREMKTRKAVKNDKGEVMYYKDVRPGFVRAGLSNFKSIGQVKAHTRHVNYDGRPFVGPALTQALPQITALLKTALQKTEAET